jgi:hypothetical protein
LQAGRGGLAVLYGDGSGQGVQVLRIGVTYTLATLVVIERIFVGYMCSR